MFTLGQATIVVAVLCIFLSGPNRCAAEEPAAATGCACGPGGGFGYELLLAKLEQIDEKLEALTRWQQTLAVRLPVPSMERPEEREGPVDPVAVEGVLPKRVDAVAKEVVDPASGQRKANLPHGIDPTPEQRPFNEDQIYSSCREVPSKVNGKYLIRLREGAEPMNLHCVMEVPDAGWIVVQLRFNGSERFYRGWNDYRDGFGTLDGEFWLGLERISTIVNDGRRWMLQVSLKTNVQQMRYSRFDSFLLGNATDGYTLRRVGRYQGNAGDSLTAHTGMQFTTFDRDNDPATYNCAKKHRGAWWYHKACVTSNLNGDYTPNASEQANKWGSLSANGLSASIMMIREVD